MNFYTFSNIRMMFPLKFSYFCTRKGQKQIIIIGVTLQADKIRVLNNKR